MKFLLVILFTWRGSNSLKISIFWGPFKSIFELTVNLGLVLTKLDTELGLAQPQLVSSYAHNFILSLFLTWTLTWLTYLILLDLLELHDLHFPSVKFVQIFVNRPFFCGSKHRLGLEGKNSFWPIQILQVPTLSL